MMRGPPPHLGGAETETRWAAKADGSVEPRRAKKKPPLRPSLRVAAAVATWRSSLQRGGRQTATRSDWMCCMLRRDAGTWNPVRPTRAGRANTPRARAPWQTDLAGRASGQKRNAGKRGPPMVLPSGRCSRRGAMRGRLAVLPGKGRGGGRPRQKCTTQAACVPYYSSSACQGSNGGKPRPLAPTPQTLKIERDQRVRGKRRETRAGEKKEIGRARTRNDHAHHLHQCNAKKNEQ